MAVKEEVKPGAKGDVPEGASVEVPGEGASSRPHTERDLDDDRQEATATGARLEAEEVHDVAPVGAASPTQLGTRRFV